MLVYTENRHKMLSDPMSYISILYLSAACEHALQPTPTIIHPFTLVLCNPNFYTLGPFLLRLIGPNLQGVDRLCFRTSLKKDPDLKCHLFIFSRDVEGTELLQHFVSYSCSPTVLSPKPVLNFTSSPPIWCFNTRQLAWNFNIVFLSIDIA